MKSCIEFYINGKFQQINAENAFKPLSSYLREKLFLTGTKEVCCEGDCGACTVLLGKFHDKNISYKPVNSCILYVYQLNNTHIITVEGLKYGEELNPVQKSIVKNHGTQCGFCTPGFVNTLYSYFNNLSENQNPEKIEIKKHLTGNLCRCTGYEGIIRSALDVKPCDVKKLNEIYPPKTLAKIIDEETQIIEIIGETQKYIKSVSLKQAVELKSQYLNAKILAGGTDNHVLANKKNQFPEVIIDISDLNELKNIDIKGDFVNFGAAVTIAEAEAVFNKYFTEFYNLLEYYASPQIKNIATIAGNIANASPVGDTIPFLMIMDSSLEICGISGKREININNFFKGYKKLDLSADEIITSVKIPLLKTNEAIKFYKITKRKHLDISTFSAAFKIRLENNIISDFAVAFGGIAAYPLRIQKVENFVKGKQLSEELFVKAGELIAGEIQPISDVRASKEYRITLAENILAKYYNEISNAEGEKCLY